MDKLSHSPSQASHLSPILQPPATNETSASSHVELYPTSNHHTRDVKNHLEITPNDPESRNSISTVVGDKDFSFEKHLKDIIKRYVQGPLMCAGL